MAPDGGFGHWQCDGSNSHSNSNSDGGCKSFSVATVHAGAVLTVVIPTFNERGNIEALVTKLDVALHDRAWEVIFVDDDSPDGTAACVKDIGATDSRVRCIRRIGRRGLAGASLEGMLASQAQYVAVMDGDLQHDEALLPLMLDAMRDEKADIVIGSRYLDGGCADDGFSKLRASISRICGWLAARLVGLHVTDPMSGFFLVRRDKLDELAPRLSTQGFKILLDILATARGTFRVKELPYVFQPRLSGESKLDSRNSLDFLGLLLAKATHDIVSLRFLSFLLVGATGVGLHIGVLKAVLLSGFSFPISQSMATFVAMTTNFFLNNALTYRDQRLSGRFAIAGLLAFYLVCSVGAVSNVGVASWLAGNGTLWWIAGFAGSMVGAIWNYAMSKTLVWKAN